MKGSKGLNYVVDVSHCQSVSNKCDVSGVNSRLQRISGNSIYNIFVSVKYKLTTRGGLTFTIQVKVLYSKQLRSPFLFPH